jgi:hypothetical protein
VLGASEGGESQGPGGTATGLEHPVQQWRLRLVAFGRFRAGPFTSRTLRPSPFCS